MAKSTLERIMHKTRRKPIECKCQLCKKQCATICLGTPEDIEKLLDAGHRDKLMVTEWGVGMMFGVINFPIPMIQAKQTDKGCIFFENGLCTLHNKGLKPTEGRLSHHSTRLDNFKFSKSISWNVAKEWINEDNLPVLERIADKMIAKQNEREQKYLDTQPYGGSE